MVNPYPFFLQFDFANNRLLRLLLVFAACVCLQAGDRLTTDGVVRKHTLYGKLHCEFRAGSHQLAVAGFLQTADVAGMGAVEFLVELLTGENGLVAVDDNNVFAAVNVGREFGTMLSAKDVGSGSGGLLEIFGTR